MRQKQQEGKDIFAARHCYFYNNDIIWENVMQIALNDIPAGALE